jgi:hypothetical protein
MSFDRDPSTPPRHRRSRRIVGPAILLAAAALFASASGAATDEGADIALVNLSMERAAVGSAYTFAYEIDNRGPAPATGVELTADLHGSFSGPRGRYRALAPRLRESPRRARPGCLNTEPRCILVGGRPRADGEGVPVPPRRRGVPMPPGPRGSLGQGRLSDDRATRPRPISR